MNNWINFLYKPEIVKAIFGENLPKLTGIVVSKLNLDYNGTEAKISLLLPNFPENPPKKWLQNAYNAVSMEMSLSVLEHIQINRWTRSNQIDLLIEKKDELIYLLAKGEADFVLAGKFLQVNSIVGYQTQFTKKMQGIITWKNDVFVENFEPIFSPYQINFNYEKTAWHDDFIEKEDTLQNESMQFFFKIYVPHQCVFEGSIQNKVKKLDLKQEKSLLLELRNFLVNEHQLKTLTP